MMTIGMSASAHAPARTAAGDGASLRRSQASTTRLKPSTIHVKAMRKPSKLQRLVSCEDTCRSVSDSQKPGRSFPRFASRGGN